MSSQRYTPEFKDEAVGLYSACNETWANLTCCRK